MLSCIVSNSLFPRTVKDFCNITNLFKQKHIYIFFYCISESISPHIAIIKKKSPLILYKPCLHFSNCCTLPKSYTFSSLHLIHNSNDETLLQSYLTLILWFKLNSIVSIPKPTLQILQTTQPALFIKHTADHNLKHNQQRMHISNHKPLANHRHIESLPQIVSPHHSILKQSLNQSHCHIRSHRNAQCSRHLAFNKRACRYHNVHVPPPTLHCRYYNSHIGYHHNVCYHYRV